MFLEAFEGPLSHLLLYLIRKQHFNVLDIPMAPLTVQHLANNLHQIRAKNLELAAEYLLMAALLIEIKSRMLLPVRKADTGEEVEDPRAELVPGACDFEYEQMKLAAMRIDELPRAGRDFVRAIVVIEQSIEKRFPDVDVVDLHEAWIDVLKRAKLHAHHHISREELSVREHMSIILKRLKGSKFVEFCDLFDHARGTAVAIVHFLALLELARESLIDITQAAPYAPMRSSGSAYTPAGGAFMKQIQALAFSGLLCMLGATEAQLEAVLAPARRRWLRLPPRRRSRRPRRSRNSPPVAAAEKWLAILDAGDYGKATDQTAKAFRDKVKREQWVESLPKTRGALGAAKSRTVEVSSFKPSTARHARRRLRDGALLDQFREE